MKNLINCLLFISICFFSYSSVFSENDKVDQKKSQIISNKLNSSKLKLQKSQNKNITKKVEKKLINEIDDQILSLKSNDKSNFKKSDIKPISYDKNKIIKVILKSKRKFSGKLISLNSQKIKLKLDYGSITINTNKIDSQNLKYLTAFYYNDKDLLTEIKINELEKKLNNLEKLNKKLTDKIASQNSEIKSINNSDNTIGIHDLGEPDIFNDNNSSNSYPYNHTPVTSYYQTPYVINPNNNYNSPYIYYTNPQNKKRCYNNYTSKKYNFRNNKYYPSSKSLNINYQNSNSRISFKKNLGVYK